jgi:hypothetical protein
MIISIISKDCTNCVRSSLMETVIMKAVHTRKFLQPCKLFVLPSQKAADTEHAVRCLFIAGNRLTGVALEGSSKEGRGQIFAVVSARA